MPRKNIQDRLDQAWDETLDGDYGGLSSLPAGGLVGYAFKFTDKGVKVAQNSGNDLGDYAGVFIRDNGQGGILPETDSQSLSTRYKDGDEVSVLLKGQVTFAIAGGAITANSSVVPNANGKWVTNSALVATDVDTAAEVAAQMNATRREGVRCKARTAASGDGDKFVLVLH